MNLTNENEKMEHEYNHKLEVSLHEQFNKSVNDLNDTKPDIIDYLANGENFKDIPKELLASGKSVIASHPDIANNQLFIVEPNGKAFLIRVENKENIKERELTPTEYKIVDFSKGLQGIPIKKKVGKINPPRGYTYSPTDTRTSKTLQVYSVCVC